MAWLLEGGVQVNTSLVSVSWNKAFIYFRASIVFFDLMVTLPARSCSAPPKDHSKARMAMLVSSSWASPIPHGGPLLSALRIFRAPLSKSSYVSGPLGRPASAHQSLCQLPGSGV